MAATAFQKAVAAREASRRQQFASQLARKQSQDFSRQQAEASSTRADQLAKHKEMEDAAVSLIAAGGDGDILASADEFSVFTAVDWARIKELGRIRLETNNLIKQEKRKDQITAEQGEAAGVLSDKNASLTDVVGAFRSQEQGARLAGKDPATFGAESLRREAHRRLDPAAFKAREAERNQPRVGSPTTFTHPKTGETITIPDGTNFAAVKAVTDRGFVKMSLSAAGTDTSSVFRSIDKAKAAVSLVDSAGAQTNTQSLRDEVLRLGQNITGGRFAAAQGLNSVFGWVSAELGSWMAEGITGVPLDEIAGMRVRLNAQVVDAIPIITGENATTRITEGEQRLTREATRLASVMSTPGELIGVLNTMLHLTTLSQERLKVMAGEPLPPLRLVVNPNGSVRPAPGVSEEQALKDLNNMRGMLADMGITGKKQQVVVLRDLVRQRKILNTFTFVKGDPNSTREVRTSTGAPSAFGN